MVFHGYSTGARLLAVFVGGGEHFYLDEHVVREGVENVCFLVVCRGELADHKLVQFPEQVAFKSICFH